VYVAYRPVYIVGDLPDQLQVILSLDVAVPHVLVDPVINEDQRSYQERLTRERIHQPIFRAKVIEAYDRRCAMCRLHYTALLDAAHILPDHHPKGLPIVPNGLSLCKIHHAAYDQNLLGVSPDLVVRAHPDVRSGIDGPMLLHGLQEMDGVRLLVPEKKGARPDPERLEIRFQEFLAGTA